MKMVMSSSRIFAKKRQSIKPYGCVAVAISPRVHPMSFHTRFGANHNLTQTNRYEQDKRGYALTASASALAANSGFM